MNRTEKSIKKFKAIELIKTFSGVEIKRFGRFLQSPYHNTNEDLVQLFSYLRSLYPAFDANKLTRPKIWKKLYKSIPFQSIKFKKLFSELNLLAEEFIIIENLKGDKRNQQKQLIAALKTRSFKRFFKESHNLIKEIKAKKEYQNQEDFLDLHLLYKGAWHHIEREKHKANYEDLLVAHETLIHYVEFSKIRAISELESMKKILNLEVLTFPDSLKVMEKKELAHENRQFHFLYDCYEFEMKPSRQSYFSLKKQIYDDCHLLNRTYLQVGILHLHNYMTKEVAIGKIGLKKEIFDLLKWAADNNIFLENNYIQEGIFSNTVIYAIKNEETSWAEDYIKNNEQYLKTSYSDLLIGYLKASIAFVSKRFEDVSVLLATLQPSNHIQYYFYFKSLITRAYFELFLMGKIEYLESLLSELEVFDKGIRRNRKFTEVRRRNYLNYVKILKKICKFQATNKYSGNSLLKLRDEVVKLSPLAQRNWLIEKIDFLLEKAATNS